jgi:hypothetical protein
VGVLAALLPSCGARTELPIGQLPPLCPGLLAKPVSTGPVEQMDLLFVIDNSRSMADKQALLVDAVPALVSRLANPLCVSADSKIEISAATPVAPCPTSFHREFAAVTDMHIGVITTSLASAGGEVCAVHADVSADDRSHLVGSLLRGAKVPTYENSGFLDWDPLGQHIPLGESDIGALDAHFRSLVELAGESGCGDEATLESWYRFLIDPKPSARITVVNGVSAPSGVDQTLLAQRARFLRPDSAVAIVMLSDENDCSIIQHGQGWRVGHFNSAPNPEVFANATAICETDPNSPCCRSCADPSTPAGCAPTAIEAQCNVRRSDEQDPSNLRCFQQKQRFGVDLLYPTARYAVGLKNATLCPASIYEDADCSCSLVRERAARLGFAEPPCTERETGAPVSNPLYANLSSEVASTRDPSQVILAAIVGVPWQDIATPATLRDPAHLEYLDVSDFSTPLPGLGIDRWRLILGDPTLNIPPADPFMRESVAPRTGQNPLTADPIVNASSLDPKASPINGHERVTDNQDLQYTCTFQLGTPRDCSGVGPDAPCECETPRSPSDPVCQPPDGGPATTTQFFAKAYPALRELDVVRQHGAQSVVASICPKPLSGRGADQELEFGYRPAISGLIKRFHCASLDAKFNDDVSSPDYGAVNCRLLAVHETDGECRCDGDTRIAADPDDLLSLRQRLQAMGLCAGRTGRDCAHFCACEVPQSEGSALAACQNDAKNEPRDPNTGEPLNGWCYLDPDAGFGAPSLVAECPAGNARNVRWTGSGGPRTGERMIAVCGDRCATANN